MACSFLLLPYRALPMPLSLAHADLPQPLGHYAPAVVHAGHVHLSGTLPLPAAPTDAFAVQMTQLLANCDAVLRHAGSNRSQVLSLTLYLTDLDRWDEADAMLAAFFGAHRPARTVIGVAQIRKQFAVQASLVAAQGEQA